MGRLQFEAELIHLTRLQLPGIERDGGGDFDQRLCSSLQFEPDEAPAGQIGFDVEDFREFPGNGIRLDLRLDFESFAG